MEPILVYGFPLGKLYGTHRGPGMAGPALPAEPRRHVSARCGATPTPA